MKENTKTLIFVLVAVWILFVAWAAQPRLPEQRPQEVVGQLLVPDFDPRSAASLEIVKYDEKEARIETFEVTHNKQKGGWSIPSHDNYPADAKEHLAEAATTFTNIKILDVAAEDPGDHKQYGVLEPDPRDPREGMGTKVIMKDKEGKELVALIIGKELRDQSPGQELRYVRRVGQDMVFIAPLNINRLSTKFEDWIEKDLLKLNPWDIKEVEIQDYSVDIVRGMIIQRGQMTLEYNDTGDPRWKLVQDLQAAEKGLQQLGLGPEEELNTAKLDDMKFALDDLKIVDVNPKPAGLSADLKAEETLITNREAVANLAARGFYPAQVEGRYEIVSNEGQIRVLMKDGVEYLLRFGGPAGAGKAEEKQAPKSESKPQEKSDEQKASPGMNRFIMVTARFNESAIPKPELEPLPEETSEKPSAEAKSELKSATAEGKPESKPESQPSEKTDPTKQEKAEPKKDPDEAKKQLEQRRQEIQKENERKQKEYQEKLEQGRKKAKELNDRFAEWYYIISEETYKKIRLSRSDIVKKKEEKKEESKEAEHKHEHDAQPKEGEKTHPPAPTTQEPKSEEPKPPREAKPGVSQPSPESKPSEPKPAPGPADKPAPAPEAASKPTPTEPEASKPPAAEPATPKPTPSNP